VATRTKRLGAVITVANGLSTVYTCPAGVVALVKQIQLSSTDATAGEFRMWMLLSGGSGPYYVYYNMAFQGFAVVMLDCWFVMHPGDQLRCVHGGGAGSCSVHGAELPSP
jgi:hypothetical protein